MNFKKLSYAFFVLVLGLFASCNNSSSDATLKVSSTVKGVIVTSLGTPNVVLASAVYGSVTLTVAQAADTSNSGSFITLFDPTNSTGATTKVVKYATGQDTSNFANDTAYNNEAVTDQDFFVIKVTAQDTTTVLYYKIIVTVTPAPLVIGNNYQCGIVAYILQAGDPGYDANVQHGLISAPTDQIQLPPGIRWYKGAYGNIGGANATALGTGLANTTAIIAAQGTPATSYAAGLAQAYIGGGCTDWYLPSKDELNKLYLNRVAIGGFTNNPHWSSSKDVNEPNSACSQDFGTGVQICTYDESQRLEVRAIRTF